jgi:hypothetical protein
MKYKGLARGRRRLRAWTILGLKEVVITEYLFWSFRTLREHKTAGKTPFDLQPGIVYFLGKMWLFNYDAGIVTVLLINMMIAPPKRRPRGGSMTEFKKIPSRRAPKEA